MRTAGPDDTERDAWLSEALRNAPDAQAVPPPALSDAILRQARAATGAAGTSATARPRSTWVVAWDWLARPPVAAGFASVMVATLVGLIWWDQPIDPNRARAPAADASPAPVPAQPAPVTTPANGEMAPQGTAQTESALPAERKLAAPKPKPVPRPAPAPQRSDPEPAPFAESRAAADAAPAVREGVGAPAPAAAPAPPTVASPPVTAMPLRDASTAAAQTAKAAAPSLLRREDADSPRPAALAALLASVGTQPERWEWQRGGPMQPMNPALQRWLTRLDAATATRWRNTADIASNGEARVLRLYRDGALAATLRLDDDSVAFGPASRAAVAAAGMSALKKALDDAAP
jgi:hypothetical protein